MDLNFSQESRSASLDIVGSDFDSLSDFENGPAIYSSTIHDIDYKNNNEKNVDKTNMQQNVQLNTQGETGH